MSVINVEIVNALLEPVSAVLRAWTGAERTLAKLDLTTELPPPPGISVHIAVRGGLVGQITWNFELPVARQIATAMLAGTGAEVDARICADAVTELSNIIAGNAVDVLAAAGYPVEIMPPETLVRSEVEILPEKALSFTFETPSGKMTMFICVQAGPAQPVSHAGPPGQA